MHFIDSFSTVLDILTFIVHSLFGSDHFHICSYLASPFFSKSVATVGQQNSMLGPQFKQSNLAQLQSNKPWPSPPSLPRTSSLHSTSSLPRSLTAIQEYLPPSKVLGLRMLRVSTPWLFCIKYFGSSPMIILFFIQIILGWNDQIQKQCNRLDQVFKMYFSANFCP